MRTIRVTGRGRLRAHPDTTRITIDLEGKYGEYSRALQRSAEDTEGLQELLSRFGFAGTELKTLNFDMEEEYESYQVRGGYQRRLTGYRYRHQTKVEFPSDNERLGKILYALANSPLHPEFRLSYTVRDPEAYRNMLLGSAVADARQKAGALTAAAGAALLDIQSIDYSFGEIRLEYSPMESPIQAKDCADELMAKRLEMDIEPDDIEITDTVTVVWEIG